MPYDGMSEPDDVSMLRVRAYVLTRQLDLMEADHPGASTDIDHCPVDELTAYVENLESRVHKARAAELARTVIIGAFELFMHLSQRQEQASKTTAGASGQAPISAGDQTPTGAGDQTPTGAGDQTPA